MAQPVKQHVLTPHQLPVELRVVLTAARAGAGDPQARADLPRLAEADRLDWQQVMLHAFHHRVFPLVTEGLERAGEPVLTRVPVAVLEELRQGRKQNALRAILISLEAQRLILALRETGAQASVLKGTPLSAMLYGDPSLRHTGDLDLLVVPEQTGARQDGARLAGSVTWLECQLEKLRGLGYTVVNPPCRLTPRREASYQRYWKDVTLESARGGPVTEMHWRLFNNRLHCANRLPEAGVEALALYGTTIPAMPRVEQFLYAVAHGCSDEWVYLKGLVDIASFLRILSPEEFDQAMQLAARLAMLAQVSSAVHLAQAWMPGEPGGAAAHRLLLPPDDRFHQIMADRVLTRLRESHFRPERRQLGPLDATRLELRLVPGWRTLVEIAGRFLWRPRIWSAYDLPDQWFWIYPLLGCLTLPRPAQAAQMHPKDEDAGAPA